MTTMICGIERVITLTDNYFAEGVQHNSISYGNLDEKDSTPEYDGSQRVLIDKVSGHVADNIILIRKVLVVSSRTDHAITEPVSAIVAILDEEVSRLSDVSEDI